MKVSEKKLVEKIKNLENKYFDLVWYSRTSQKMIDENIIIRKKVNEILKKYPTDILLLKECGDWTHGFNSGSLSGMRYVLDLIYEGEEFSEQIYPNLDT
jgi:hypothetical protein